MPLQIGLITGEYPPMEGGVGAFTQELAKALAVWHEVHILTGRGARPLSPKTKTSVSKARQSVDLGFATLYPFINRWRWPSMAVAADWTLRYELDVVNIQYQPAAFNMKSGAINLLPWRLKGAAKTVVTFHDLRVPYLFPKAGKLRRWAVNFMTRQADGVIATNRADYDSLQRLEIGKPLKNIPIGSNIVAREVEAGEITAVRRELNLQDDDCLLGYFGFLNESKGADTLLRALAQLDEQVHLVFIGGRTGSSDEANNQVYFEQLDGLIIELNLTERVHWTGFVPEHHVSAYLNAADLMVMPYRDGSSLRRGTLMAALAHGRPLISTTPTTSTPELEHGRNVWFVPVDDVSALAAAIQTVLADADLRTHLGQGAAQVADLFTWDKIAGDTAVFYERLI
ncbi:MAG: glycosyltransferase family 4 protein [Chloroflexi bacterium]|nr:glycosyltransferase family 4 protein [Chloroflexota bacterium]